MSCLNALQRGPGSNRASPLGPAIEARWRTLPRRTARPQEPSAPALANASVMPSRMLCAIGSHDASLITQCLPVSSSATSSRIGLTRLPCQPRQCSGRISPRRARQHRILHCLPRGRVRTDLCLAGRLAQVAVGALAHRNDIRNNHHPLRRGGLLHAAGRPLKPREPGISGFWASNGLERTGRKRWPLRRSTYVGPTIGRAIGTPTGGSSASSNCYSGRGNSIPALV